MSNSLLEYLNGCIPAKRESGFRSKGHLSGVKASMVVTPVQGEHYEVPWQPQRRMKLLHTLAPSAGHGTLDQKGEIREHNLHEHEGQAATRSGISASVNAHSSDR